MRALPDSDPTRIKTRIGFLDRTLWITDMLAALGLLAMMVLVTVDILGRTLFNAPLAATSELMELLVAFCAAFVMPSLALHGLHATIDVLDAWVPSSLRPWQMGIANIAGCVTFGAVGWRLWIDAARTARGGGQTPLLELPMSYVIQVIAVIFALSAFCFAIVAARYLRKILQWQKQLSDS